jgi:hypothetical protein
MNISPTAPELEYDLFLSYGHSDNEDGWISALVAAVQQEHARFFPQPLRIFFDRSSIRTMDDWEHRILRGLRSSKAMIALLSPAYFASQYCRTEWKMFLEHELDRAIPGEGIAPVYMVGAPTFEQEGGTNEHDWITDLRRRQYTDFRRWRALGLGAFEDPECRRLIAGLEQDIAPKLAKAESALSSNSNVPAHNPNFAGRTQQLRRLWELVALQRVGAIVALQGLPGMGKSALAFEYAHRQAADYPGGRFLLNAAGAVDLRVLLIDLAPHLGIDITEEQRKSLNVAFGLVRARLESGPRTLLLLDNVDDRTLLEPHRRGELPATDDVHVILTTQLDPQYLPGIECEPIGGLPEEDALRLLEHYRPFANEDEKAAAQEIVRRLDGYVLELEVVAVYLWQTPDVSYTAYLERFRQEGLMAVEGAAQQDTVMLSRHSQKSVSKELKRLLDRLSPLERFALGLAALFHPDHIPLPWVRGFLQAKGVLEGSLPGYPDPWRQLERRLLGLRLLTGAGDPKLARMHRVIQEVVAATYPELAADDLPPIAKHAVERAQTIKVTFDPSIFPPAQTFWEWQAIQGFAFWLLEKQETDAGCTLAYFAAAILPWRADENERLLRSAIGLAQQALADNADRDRFLAACYLALADVFVVRDRYQEARDALSHAAEHSRIDPGLSKKLVLMRDYVGHAENQYYVALTKMRAEYWDRLASVGADHPDARSLDEWLKEHDPSWIRCSEPVAWDAVVAGTGMASQSEERRDREIARIENFLAVDSENVSAELVAEFRRLVECGSPSGEIRDEIVPIVLQQHYERERRKPNAVVPFTLEEMYEHLRYGIMGLANGDIQAYSGSPSFKGPLEHWLAQVLGERTEAFLEEALRLRILEHDEPYQFSLVVRDQMAFGYFLGKLGDRETKYRSHAALILGDVGDPRALDTLVAVLEDESDDSLVRAHVAMALAAIQDERAVLPLMLLLDDEHEVTRDGVYLKAFAKAGIRRIGTIALDVLFKTLAAPQPLMRAYAIEALVHLADPRAISRLQALHNDGGLIPRNRLGVQGDTVAERSYNAIGVINAFAKAQRG